VFVTTVTRLADHLETNVGQTSVEHRATVLGYASQARELIGYLRSLTGEWQSYIDTIENQGTKHQFLSQAKDVHASKSNWSTVDPQLSDTSIIRIRKFESHNRN